MTTQTYYNEQLHTAAKQFIDEAYTELGHSETVIADRLSQIAEEIAATGTYSHTSEELTHGARMAWRNSNRCIGRFFWQMLTVLDYRHLTTADEMAAALFEHIEFGTNDGKIRPAISVFAAERADGDGPRIWNAQLLRYAGYEQPGGSVLGDPITKRLTAECLRLGWDPQSRSAFDLLPLVIQAGREEAPKLYDIPKSIVKEVALRHPRNPRFAEQLQLKWYAVPMVSNMRLEIGGIDYRMAPFNGWYMGTEIGARNLADVERYNLLPDVARIFDLDQSAEATLWKDQAMVELNVAVLHSFKEDGVTIVDHHTAAKQFAMFTESEQQAGRTITGDWSWLIPPMSPSTTHVWHRGFDQTQRRPNYLYQKDCY